MILKLKSGNILDYSIVRAYDNSLTLVATNLENNKSYPVLWLDKDGTILRNVASGDNLKALGIAIESSGIKVVNP